MSHNAYELEKQYKDSVRLTDEKCLRFLERAEKAESLIFHLRDSLQKLANETSGFLAMACRDTHGSTNMSVLKMRIDDARALLESTKDVVPK